MLQVHSLVANTTVSVISTWCTEVGRDVFWSNDNGACLRCCADVQIMPMSVFFSSWSAALHNILIRSRIAKNRVTFAPPPRKQRLIAWIALAGLHNMPYAKSMAVCITGFLVGPWFRSEDYVCVVAWTSLEKQTKRVCDDANTVVSKAISESSWKSTVFSSGV